MPVHWRRFLPAGILASFQTQMLCLIYCETTIATWCLTFWQCLFPLWCVWKLQLPSERMLMLSQRQYSQRLATRGWKTQWCARERATVVFVFTMSGFCFVCAFVLSTSLAYVWCRVVGSWWPLAEAPGACQRRVCYPAGIPVIWGHATLARVTRPAVAHSAWQFTWGQKHIV